MSLFLQNLKDQMQLLAVLGTLNQAVGIAGEMAINTLRNGGKIMFCGNGGSAADCQHLSAELTGRFLRERRPLAALALSTDTSALTCIGNDYSFEETFARQIQGLGRAGDLLIAISTSGNSGNIVRAVEEANKLHIHTIGLLGNSGGKLRNICKHNIIVPSPVTARIQECHILIGHTLCGLIDDAFVSQ